MVDYRKHDRKPEKHAAHRNREKKRICWHLTLQRLKVEYPLISRLAFDSNQIWKNRLRGFLRSLAIRAHHNRYARSQAYMRLTRGPRYSNGNGGSATGFARDFYARLTLFGALPQGFSGSGDPVVFSARRGRLPLSASGLHVLGRFHIEAGIAVDKAEMVVHFLDAGGVFGGDDRGLARLVGGDDAMQMHDAVAH